MTGGQWYVAALMTIAVLIAVAALTYEQHVIKGRRILSWRTRSRLRYWFSRWPLAGALNRLSWTCWCDLVDWALARSNKPRAERPRLLLDDGGDRYRVLNRGMASPCRRDAASLGLCYCGKFRTAEAERAYGMGPGVVVDAEERRWAAEDERRQR